MPPRPDSIPTVNATPFGVSYYDTDPNGDGWELVFSGSKITIRRNSDYIASWDYEAVKKPSVHESDFDEVFS